jgi:hypothetical protein
VKMISILQSANGGFEILGIRRQRIPPQLLSALKKIRNKSHQVKAFLLNVTLTILIEIFPYIFSRLVLSNDTSSKKDGTGAQIQRLLAIASLAERLNVPFVQSRIHEVAVHPLDGFNSSDSYKKFLDKLNYLFEIHDEQEEYKIDEIVRIKNFELSQLIRIAVKAYKSKRVTRIEIENPYPLSDLRVDQYQSVRRKLKNLWGILIEEPKDSYIAIHYRQGVGNFAVYPGQAIPREIDLNYFKSRLNELVNEVDRSRLELHVFTDAPTTVLNFKPPVDQWYLWEGTPGFKDGIMTVQPQVFCPEDFGVNKVVVHSGGDPIEAIIQMARANLLITGRSSLSYLAGLMNVNGTVVGAPEFWHPSLQGWK